jgi:uncharacterized protein (DUF924 family)
MAAMAEGALPERAQALIDFWFGPPGDPDREVHRQIWFKCPPEHDDLVRRLFLEDYERAASGELVSWEAAPESALALVLLLDQIPRNVFRDTPRAYATDPLARAVADRAMARGFDAAFPPVWRKFFYMPLHHSENLEDQRRATALTNALPDDRDPEDPERRGGLRRYGLPYPEVIERFGRFPHRNVILGRTSTPEELVFMKKAEPAS